MNKYETITDVYSVSWKLNRNADWGSHSCILGVQSKRGLGIPYPGSSIKTRTVDPIPGSSIEMRTGDPVSWEFNRNVDLGSSILGVKSKHRLGIPYPGSSIKTRTWDPVSWKFNRNADSGYRILFLLFPCIGSLLLIVICRK